VASINPINNLACQTRDLGATALSGALQYFAWQDWSIDRSILPTPGGMMNIQILIATLLLISPSWAQTKPSVPVRTDPCAPIGRTADGQLVYSMKCEKLPVPVVPPQAAAPAPPLAPVVEEARGGLFRNPFPSLVRPSSSSDEREAGVGPPPSSR
jgi:hypothetical protein